MPLYEFKCLKCGTILEIFKKVNDPSPQKCSKCQGPLKKILSPPALQFKGSGWYVTDYAAKGSQHPKSSSEKKRDEDQKPAKEKEESSSESKK